MHTSGKDAPCPACGRTKDLDCRWSDDIILCHSGTDLRPGQTISVDGQPWAFIRHNAGFSGAAALFRPHRNGHDITPAHNIEQKARNAVASFTLDRFLERFQRCWNIPDFHTLPPHHLQFAFELIDSTYADGLELSRSMAPLWRQDKALADRYRWRIDAANKSLRFQQQDAHHFRSHYLGEVAA